MGARQVLFPLAIGVVLASCAGCGSSSSSPTPGATPTPIAAVSPTPSPTPTGIVLPAGMACSPTPPPLLRMQVKVHGLEEGRTVLDSSPLVPNVDGYCDRVGFGDWKYCNTRQEGDPQREACDYLTTGKADTGRWGPTWIGEGKPCGTDFSLCANHPTNQFMAIAKGKGEFQACVAADAPLSDRGERCTIFGYYD